MDVGGSFETSLLVSFGTVVRDEGWTYLGDRYFEVVFNQRGSKRVSRETIMRKSPIQEVVRLGVW